MTKEQLKNLIYKLVDVAEFHADLGHNDRVDAINNAIGLIDKAYGDNAPLTIDSVLKSLEKAPETPFQHNDEVLILVKGTIDSVWGQAYGVKVVDKDNNTIDMFTHDGKMWKDYRIRQLFNLTKEKA